MKKLIGHNYIDNNSNFTVFAPQRREVSLVLTESNSIIPMEKDSDGYWSVTIPKVEVGTKYMYSVNGNHFPDPASKKQSEGVHSASSVIEEKVNVIDKNWHGVSLKDAIIYEMHLGTFTKDGTIAAAKEKLEYLSEIGVTVVELLPIAEFPGDRNWGYDGVYQFAVANSYGSIEDIKDFINAAHQYGIAVVLDVVYNHFGPEGNYSGVYGKYTFDAATPWGAAINFDKDYSWGIRDFFLENVRYWLEDIKFDGLRMDAVSCIYDESPTHILREITDLAKSIEKAENRKILMIAEHLRNDANVTNEKKYNYDTQWNDDINYAIFSYLTKEKDRHYHNFGEMSHIEKALKEGFVMDGTKICKLYKSKRGSSGVNTKAVEHVVHIQDHDQVGNRPRGDRMITTYGRDRALLGVTAMMISPYIPMLFMGEEYGETNPFLFFTDFSDERVISGVRKGRKEEFSFEGFEPLDPQSLEAFQNSKLNWSLVDTKSGSEIKEYYKELIKLKKLSVIGPRDKDLVKYCIKKDIVISVTNDSISILNFGENTKSLDLNTINNQLKDCIDTVAIEDLCHLEILLTSNKSTKVECDRIILREYSSIIFARKH